MSALNDNTRSDDLPKDSHQGAQAAPIRIQLDIHPATVATLAGAARAARMSLPDYIVLAAHRASQSDN